MIEPPPSTRMHRGGRRRALVTVAIGITIAVSGCSGDTLAEQYLEGGNKGYIAGDGAYTEIPPQSRADAVSFEAVVEDGTPIASKDLLGSVTVVNFWYASCPPCRAEAGDLEAAYQKYLPDGVRFLGVNTRDQPSTAISFAKEFAVTYPSVIDVGNANVQLAFTGVVAPNAVPATLVLDREGRVASRVLGQIDPGVLDTLIADTLSEGE